MKKETQRLNKRSRTKHLARLACETVQARKNKYLAQILTGDMSAVTRSLNTAHACRTTYQISASRAASIDRAAERAVVTQVEFFDLSTLGVKP